MWLSRGENLFATGWGHVISRMSVIYHKRTSNTASRIEYNSRCQLFSFLGIFYYIGCVSAWKFFFLGLLSDVDFSTSACWNLIKHKFYLIRCLYLRRVHCISRDGLSRAGICCFLQTRKHGGKIGFIWVLLGWKIKKRTGRIGKKLKNANHGLGMKDEQTGPTLWVAPKQLCERHSVH